MATSRFDRSLKRVGIMATWNGHSKIAREKLSKGCLEFVRLPQLAWELISALDLAWLLSLSNWLTVNTAASSLSRCAQMIVPVAPHFGGSGTLSTRAYMGRG